MTFTVPLTTSLATLKGFSNKNCRILIVTWYTISFLEYLALQTLSETFLQKTLSNTNNSSLYSDGYRLLILTGDNINPPTPINPYIKN